MAQPRQNKESINYNQNRFVRLTAERKHIRLSLSQTRRQDTLNCLKMRLNFKYRFAFAILFSLLFRTIPRVSACCLHGHRSHRRMSVGVLGSPERNFVDTGQARLFFVNGKALAPERRLNASSYTILVCDFGETQLHSMRFSRFIDALQMSGYQIQSKVETIHSMQRDTTFTN